MYKTFLKLLGYGVGSVVMYWGLLLLVLAFWLLALLLHTLANTAWNRITGKTDQWQGFLNWTESLSTLTQHPRFSWIGWTPGILILIWYAGYAANLVHTAPPDRLEITAIVLQAMGLLGILIATLVFYGIYHFIVETKLPQWAYIPVVSIAMTAYFFFLNNPTLATALGESWQRAFVTFLSALL